MVSSMSAAANGQTLGSRKSAVRPMATPSIGASALLVLSILGWVFLPRLLGACTQGSPDGCTISLLFYLRISWVLVGRPAARPRLGVAGAAQRVARAIAMLIGRA
jgi:hypothetical protein